MKSIADASKWMVRLALLALVLGGAALILPGCRGQTTSEPGPESQPDSGKAYSCPMHPEVTQTGPGTCPKCGMDLVKSDEEHMN